MTVVAGVYRVSIESPCDLYGNGWYLTASFQRQRTINASLQAQTVDFPLNITIVELLINLSDFEPIVSELKLLDESLDGSG